ncbi:MAG: T9SS type A sorting domain-containing protein [Cytophagaceae bacterium]
MKIRLLFLFLLSSFFASAQSSLYEQLCGVNAEWHSKTFDDPILKQRISFQNDDDLIRFHLMFVEKKLREAPVAHLSDQHRGERLKNLDHLNRYWKEGRFPRNFTLSYRQPFFMNDEDRICAVGYLVVQSGNLAFAQQIQTENNNAFIREINVQFPAFGIWSESSGLSLDELAWIQPGYPPNYPWAPCDKGVDGEVNATIVYNDLLYVFGDFARAGDLEAPHCAIWDGEEWSLPEFTMPGPVAGAIIYDNKIYAAVKLNFSATEEYMVTYWDDNTWIPGPVLDGKVKTMVIFEDNLYCAGDFNGLLKINEETTVLLDGLNNSINVLAVHNNELYAGGAFTITSDEETEINYFAKWGEDGWEGIPNDLDAPVYSMVSNDGYIYLGGSMDDFGLARWSPEYFDNLKGLVYDHRLSGSFINQFFPREADMLIGVSNGYLCEFIDHEPFIFQGNRHLSGEFYVVAILTGRINCLVDYQSRLHAGGDFINAQFYNGIEDQIGVDVTLNGIGYVYYGIPPKISIRRDTLCKNQDVYLSITSGYRSPNIFQIELSDEDGTFPGTIVKEVNSSQSVGVTFSIPAQVVSANSYKLRVKRSNPEYYSNVINLITIVDVPETVISGPEVICLNQEAEIFIDPVKFSFFDWTLPEGWVGSSQENIINISHADDAQSGMIQVSVTNFCGEFLGEFTLPNPYRMEKPVIVQEADMSLTTSQDFNSFVWIFNEDEEVSTTYQIERPETGNYIVTVTNEAGCSASSDIFSYVQTNTRMANSDLISLYPNPAPDRLNITFKGYKSSVLNIRIVDAKGDAVVQETMSHSSPETFVSLDINSLKPGIYNCTISNGEEVYNKKFVKY